MKQDGYVPGQEIPAHKSEKFMAAVITTAREAGIDIEKWLRARSLICVMGATVEAALTGQGAADVLESYACEGDLRDLVRDHVRAGIDPGAIHHRIDDALARAHDLIQRQDVRDAIGALSDRLLAQGLIRGRTVASIIRQHLAE